MQWIRCIYDVSHSFHGPLARYVKLRVAHAPGMPGTFFPPPRVSDPDMHHGTCVTHVPGCMPGSLSSGFLWTRWRGKRSRHSRRMRYPQFYVSGKRCMGQHHHAEANSFDKKPDHTPLTTIALGHGKFRPFSKLIMWLGCPTMTIRLHSASDFHMFLQEIVRWLLYDCVLLPLGMILCVAYNCKRQGPIDYVLESRYISRLYRYTQEFVNLLCIIIPW